MSLSVVRIKTTAKEKSGLRTDFKMQTVEEIQKITGIIGEAYAALAVFELRFQKDNDTPVDQSSKPQ